MLWIWAKNVLSHVDISDLNEEICEVHHSDGGTREHKQCPTASGNVGKIEL